VTDSTSRVSLLAGAFKTGTHDDLVTATGLAVLMDPSGRDAVMTPSPWAG
jgi:hypothetical protein